MICIVQPHLLSPGHTTPIGKMAPSSKRHHGFNAKMTRATRKLAELTPESLLSMTAFSKEISGKGQPCGKVEDHFFTFKQALLEAN
jgi:hypothetical protein